MPENAWFLDRSHFAFMLDALESGEDSISSVEISTVLADRSSDSMSG
jgi:hypothetical protein